MKKKVRSFEDLECWKAWREVRCFIQSLIKKFPEDNRLQILNGRWGPYISYGDENFRIPRGKTPEELTHEQCMTIIKESREKKSKKK